MTNKPSQRSVSWTNLEPIFYRGLFTFYNSQFTIYYLQFIIYIVEALSNGI